MTTLITRDPGTMGSTLAPTLAPLNLMRNLLRWDPFRDMGMDFDVQPAFTPSFDIKETSDAYVFEADLPGIREEDLDINLTGNRLTISGKRESQSRQESDKFFAMERSYGAFARTFNLPEGVDGNNIRAELKDGVLCLNLPKTPEVQPKKISVSTSGKNGGQQGV